MPLYDWYVARWLRGDSNAPRPPKNGGTPKTPTGEHCGLETSSRCPTAQYPYCQWDLMFHAVAFAEIDPGEAKRQSRMLRQASYTANNGQSPAYEWALSDANPPIGAWAALRIFQISKRRDGATTTPSCAPACGSSCWSTAGGPTAPIATATACSKGLPPLDNIAILISVTPQRRQPHRTIRWHGLDGHAQPQHAGSMRSSL